MPKQMRGDVAEEPSVEPQGCVFEHFLPSRVVATYQKEQALAEAVLAALAGVRVPRMFRNEPLPPEVTKLVRSLPLPEEYYACLSGPSPGPTLRRPSPFFATGVKVGS